MHSTALMNSRVVEIREVDSFSPHASLFCLKSRTKTLISQPSLCFRLQTFEIRLCSKAFITTNETYLIQKLKNRQITWHSKLRKVCDHALSSQLKTAELWEQNFIFCSLCFGSDFQTKRRRVRTTGFDLPAVPLMI